MDPVGIDPEKKQWLETRKQECIDHIERTRVRHWIQESNGCRTIVKATRTMVTDTTTTLIEIVNELAPRKPLGLSIGRQNTSGGSASVSGSAGSPNRALAS